MLKLLIGPALLGAGYIAGSAYGRDAEQVVRKSPSVTYAAVEQALGNVRQSGTTFFDGGAPIPYELKIERALDQRLTVTLLFDGRRGAEANIDFVPQNGGRDTLVAARIHGDHNVLRSALAGTSRARLAYAPDWMLNLSFRPVLQQLATQIEKGGTAEFEGAAPGDAESQWEAGLNQEQREKVSEWQQYEATRPAVDPNADAQRYMKGSGGSN
jgi:hypothetical protein